MNHVYRSIEHLAYAQDLNQIIFRVQYKCEMNLMLNNSRILVF